MTDLNTIENGTLAEIQAEGYDRGYCIATWSNPPDLGDRLPLDIDWVGLGTVETEEDAREAFDMMCHAAEEQDRCFSPFEEVAKAINERPDAEEAWDAFELGITEGIHAEMETRDFSLETEEA